MLFTRQADFTVHPERGGEFLERYREIAAQILSEQPGFDSHMVLAEGNHYVTLTFWKDQSAAQTFADRGMPLVLTKLKPLLNGKPAVRSLMLLEGAVPTAPPPGATPTV